MLPYRFGSRHTKTRSCQRAGGLVIWVFALAGACAPDTPPPQFDTGSDREIDGLVESPIQQQIVDFQVLRQTDSLLPFLEHDEPVVRARAAFALASVQDSRAVEALRARLRDPAPGVRADAAFALGQSADSSVAPALFTAFLREEDPVVRNRLMEALGKKGGPATLLGLAGAELPEENWRALAMAVARYALRGLNHPRAVDLVADLLAADDAVVRRNAAYYFGRNRTTQPWVRIADVVRVRLDNLGGDDPASFHLVLALARLESPDDHRRLINFLTGADDWRIRASAAAALSTAATNDRVGRALVDALDDGSEHVAVSAAATLARADDLRSGILDRLQDWVTRHPHRSRVNGYLLSAVGNQGRGDFVVDWIRDLPDTASTARAYATPALATLPAPEPFAILVEWASSPDIRLAAAATAALRDRRAQPQRQDDETETFYTVFSEGLNSGEPARAAPAAEALSDRAFLPLGSVAVLTAAWEHMQWPRDLEAMVEILRALGRAGDPVAVPTLREAMGHPHPVIQEAAATSLARLTGRTPAPPEQTVASDQKIDWDYLLNLGPRPRLRITTNRGLIVAELDAEQAPLTSQTVLRLAADGSYDGVPFHRVVSNFVVQGGDVAGRAGYGGPGFTIPSEFTRIPFERGVLGMASSGKDTEGSQFFITHSVQPHLDGRYTAFGRVIQGLSVLDALVQDDFIITARPVTPAPSS